MRQQAYTLFAKTYEDARRAITYIRAEYGDADEIAPTFFVGRGSRGSAAPSSQPAAPETSTKAPASPAAETDAPPAIQVNNPHNLPIDSPYVS